jgi:hypothetical protein
MRSDLALLFALILLAAQVGCARTSPQADTTDQARPIAVKFGDGADLQFNFGHVIGDPTRKLSHTFTLQNQTGKAVKVAEVVNGMPCCGEVEPIQTKELLPGDSLNVTVRVRPSRIGPMRHWAAVITDDPNAEEIKLATLADVHAPLRIEAMDEYVPDVAAGHDITKRYQLVECFSASERTNPQGGASGRNRSGHQ